MRAAYMAMEKWLSTINNPFLIQRVRGLENATPQELFFLTYAFVIN